MSKDMDVIFPSMDVCWLGTDWFFSFGNKFIPRFMILDDGRMLVVMTKKVTASSNRFIDETIYWAFSDPKEIDDLISQLDINKIKEKLTNTEKSSELFK